MDLFELQQSLNDRQLEFIDIYLTNGKNATSAYLDVYENVAYDSAKAGAHNLLKKEHVQKYIRLLRDKYIKSLKIDKNYIIEQYLDVINSSKFDDEKVDRHNWNKALANLTDLLGLNEEQKMEITHNIQPLFPDVDYE